jgi:peptidoglycan/LPS O-acetylase OafA/YrhL
MESGPAERVPEILPESGKTPYYPALDGVRTVAIAMVMARHYWGSIAPLGWMGVQLFFVLSGFLITGILFDTRNAKHRFKNFYARRALRIFPLYYGFLAAALIVLFLTKGPVHRYFLLWPVYLQNFFEFLYPRATDILFTGHGRPFTAVGHLWSLAVEEQFYLVWPLLVFSVKDRKRLMQLSWLIICGRLILAVYWQHHLPAYIVQRGLAYRMLPTQADGFLMGGLVALWMRGRPSGFAARRSGTVAVVALSLFAALLFALHGHNRLCNGECYSYLSGFQATIGLPLTNLVSALVVLAATQVNTWIYRLCHLGPMRSLGRVSYGLYVFHIPVLVVVDDVVRFLSRRLGLSLVHPNVSAVVSAVVTCGVAYASFYLWERPFLRLKNRFTNVHKERVDGSAGVLSRGDAL